MKPFRRHLTNLFRKEQKPTSKLQICVFAFARGEHEIFEAFVCFWQTEKGLLLAHTPLHKWWSSCLWPSAHALCETAQVQNESTLVLWFFVWTDKIKNTSRTDSSYFNIAPTALLYFADKLERGILAHKLRNLNILSIKTQVLETKKTSEFHSSYF